MLTVEEPRLNGTYWRRRMARTFGNRSDTMLGPLNRYSRDSTLCQFTTKRLRNLIDPKQLSIQIDGQFDYQKFVEPL